MKKNLIKSQSCEFLNTNRKKRKYGELDLFETKSNLKNLNIQQKAYKPQKNYSKDYNLILNEIGKEIKEIEDNYNEKSKSKQVEGKNDENLFMTQYNKKCITPDNNKNFALINRIHSSNINKKNKEKEKIKLKKNNNNIYEIVERLYYKPTRRKFGLNEIKKYLKLTEFVAIDVAKRNILLNKMKKNEFFK